MTSPTLRLVVAALAALCPAVHPALAQAAPDAAKPAMSTPVESDNLDPAAFAQQVDGPETSLSGPDQGQAPQWLIWTNKTRPGHSGCTFGDSRTPGARHLRIGFKNPLAVGSVLVSGGGQVSVLQPDAAYPGDLKNDADWIPAERLKKGEMTRTEVGKGEVALWTLPPGTQTRALRFTHVADTSDAAYAGYLGAAFVASERWSDLAPQAFATGSANAQKADKLNNGESDTFRTWDNLDNKQPPHESQPVVSPQNAPWVMLTWPAPVKLDGLNAIGAGFLAAEAQAYVGPADKHPRDAADSDWKTLRHFAGLEKGYPVPLWPNRLDFGQVVTTRAVRLKMTAPMKETGGHGKGDTKDGKRVWLGELLALQPLGDAPLQAITFPVIADGPHPPIPVRFKLDKPGFVTLVIEDESGKRVRNLISETPFPAGDSVAWWDGTDDLGRDVDAAKHGVYKIPAQFVTPGKYTVRGLVRGEIEPRYEFPIYSGGHPAWETADKTGGWLTNHTPPQAALFVPAEKSPTGAAMVYLGSAVSEGGAGLAWVDLNGKKIGGRGWVGGNWTSAPFLARDEGAKADPNVFAYVGAAWTASTDNKDKTHGELRITGLTAKDDKPIIKHPFTPPAGEDGDHHWIDQLGGIAARDGLLVASMNKLGTLVFIDARESKVLGTLPLASPRGLAFDAQGRLLVLTGSKLVRFVLPPDPAKLALHLTPDAQSGVPLPSKGWSATASKQSPRATLAFDGDPATRWDTGGAMQKGDSFSLDLGAPRTFFKITMTASASDDFARSYEVFVSDDGQNWGQSLVQGSGERGRTRIALAKPVTARFVRIVQTGSGGNFWSINELTLDAPIPAGERAKPLALPAEALISKDLEDPHGLTLDGKGHIFISEHGASHQVKVFTPAGKLSRTIGKAGAPKTGPYDPLHLNHPTGMAIDPDGRLWVTENDYLPKRVSVWNTDGTLWKSFYGPAKYGGGGTLDPQDKARFYYADEGRGAMEFALDWEKGESKVARVYYRRGPDSMSLPDRSAAPETALYHDGRRYFTNCYNSNPTGGSTAFLFVERDGIARPVAGFGRAANWALLRTEAFAARMPEGANWKNKPPLFLWSDANDDAQVQPDEVTLHAEQVGGVTFMTDLSLCAARVGEKARRFVPTGFTKGGAPRYDFAKGETLAEGVQPPGSSGGDQVLVSADGWSAITLGIAPFARQSLSGAKNGAPKWSYPSAWPGLHAAHEAPAPDRPGQLIGTTRLLGGFITPQGSDAGPIWAVNANMGTLYLFTADGLFVATVFEDKRQGKSWAMPVPERNMSLKGFTLSEENFWPTWSQTPEGKVYVMNGAKASLVRLDGLESIRRLPSAPLTVTSADLQKAQSYLVNTEVQRQQAEGRGVLEMAMPSQAPSVDGKLDDWAGAAWVDIDKSGVAANFNSNSKPYDITAAVAVAGDRLYAAFRTGDDKLLLNSGEVPNAPFKTGGALDLMLSTSPEADPKRTTPVVGDLRLLVTLVKGQPKAVLYRAVVPGTKEPVPFSSPWRTITLDRADDVSAQVQLAGAGGNYELSIPLATLGLKPTAGQSLQGDVGILRGNGTETTARVYWSNKATGITSDVPSEAMLTPLLWGRIEIKAAK